MKLIDLDKAKSEIIREIAQSNEFIAKCKNTIYKRQITEYTGIIDDLIQEVVQIALKRDSADIYDMYLNPKKNGDNRVLGWMLGILKMQFRKHPSGYTNHNLLSKLYWTSNLNDKFRENDINFGDLTSQVYTPLWIYTGNAEDDVNIDSYKAKFEKICKKLTQKEIDLLHFIMSSDKKGKYTKKYQEEKEALFEKIRNLNIKY